MNWAESLQQVLQSEACVLVTMKLILGSVPRESGARMIVTTDATIGSIGGGNLEWSAIKQARGCLAEFDAPWQKTQAFGLGPALNQCCGGAVTLHFEYFPQAAPDWLNNYVEHVADHSRFVHVMAVETEKPFHCIVEESSSINRVPADIAAQAIELLAKDEALHELPDITELDSDDGKWWLQPGRIRQPELYLFGAGYVGQEVIRILKGLPFDLSWIDSRTDVFPDPDMAGVKLIHSNDPQLEVHTAPPGTLFVVMTHSHELDEDICFEILQRNDFSWLGLIGSKTKKRRFVQRLNKRGIDEQDLNRLVCPIGLVGINGKQPATIALSLAAQLMMEKPWIHAKN